SLLNRNPLQEFEVVENLRCAEHHAAQRVVGDAYRQTGLFRIRLSRFFSEAPPPASTMPQSLMSAESSAGVRSRPMRIALTIVDTHSPNALRISLSSTVIVLGLPSMRLRPLISSSAACPAYTPSQSGSWSVPQCALRSAGCIFSSDNS